MRADAVGRPIGTKAYDIYPAGWAVSGDANVVAYLDRSAGYEGVIESSEPVWLDLFVYRPDSDQTVRYERIARMPCLFDFYGPAISMAVDQAGMTAVFVDPANESAARLTRVDLAAGTAKTLCIVPLYAGLAISPDGRAAAVHLSERRNWGLVDLETGAVKDLVAGGDNARFSPDGTKLAMTLADTVTLVDLASGRIEDLGPGTLIGWAADSAKVFVSRTAK